jgi:hypothetical protein
MLFPQGNVETLKHLHEPADTRHALSRFSHVNLSDDAIACPLSVRASERLRM